MNSDIALQFGPWVAIALFIIKWATAEIDKWKTRQWTKQDTDQNKIEQLYEERLEQQLVQQKDTLLIIDRNADTLTDVQKEVAQVRTALETEIPPLVEAVRELIRQTARGAK